MNVGLNTRGGRMLAGGIGAGAVVAVGAAGLSVFCGLNECRAPVDYEVCVHDGVTLVEGLAGECRAPVDFAEFLDRPLTDAQGAPVVVSLADPVDDLAPEEDVTTCATYEAKTTAGWYALSGAARRREAYFTRACGALQMLVQAQQPRVSYFVEGGLELADVANMPMTDMPRIGPGAPGEYADATVAADGPWQWKITGRATELTIQEIAHADFDRDGYGDVLAFVALGARGGTAAAGAPALIEKRSADGPARMRMR